MFGSNIICAHSMLFFFLFGKYN